MRRTLAIVTVLLLACGVYYFFFYPPSVLERRTEAALAKFDATMVPQQRDKVSGLLNDFLAVNASIKLEVGFFTPFQNTKAAPMMQTFDKPTFITFIDNVLYPLEDYSFSSMIRSFTLSPDHKSAQLAFISKEWADGVSLYGGTSVNVRYSSDTECTGQVSFDGDKVQLVNADCKMELRTVPRPGEEAKFHNMETMQDLINQNR